MIEGLEISLFERWLNAGVSPTFLDTQYRMHPALSAFSSSNFYNGRLKYPLQTISENSTFLRDGITTEDRILPFQTDVWNDPSFPISFINVEGKNILCNHEMKKYLVFCCLCDIVRLLECNSMWYCLCCFRCFYYQIKKIRLIGSLFVYIFQIS